MTGIPLSTALDQPITAWLAHQRALGRDYGTEERVLEALKRFVARLPVPDLDQAGFELFAITRQLITKLAPQPCAEQPTGHMHRAWDRRVIDGHQDVPGVNPSCRGG